jgi:uncharacterized delta-60 repeat protein
MISPQFSLCRGWVGSLFSGLALLISTSAGQDKSPTVGTAAGGAGASLTIALDPEFGKDGMIAEHPKTTAPMHFGFRALAVDRQGRPVAAGYSTGQRFLLARYTLEGRPDATFGAIGKALICIEDQETVDAAGSSEVQYTHDMIIDANGRIYIVGKGAGLDSHRKSDFAVLRFDNEGNLDKTFGGVGYKKYRADDSPNMAVAVAAAPDGSAIVVAGYSQDDKTRAIEPLLLRIRDNGAVDEAFSATANSWLGGLIKDDASATPSAVAIDREGQYLVALNIRHGRGSRWALARLKRNGEIDESFGQGGLWSAALDDAAAKEFVCSIALDPSGGIVLGGYSDDGSGFRRLAVARLTDNGRPDTEFGPDAKGHVVLDDYGSDFTHRFGPRAVVFQDHIAITGSLTGANGNSRCFGVAVMDQHGKSIAKVRPKAFPGSKGNDQPWGIAFDSDGRIIVAGMSQAPTGRWRMAVARYLIK